MDFHDRTEGALLGTALGDALGLPAEGLDARTIARRFGRMTRFRLLGRRGFVSDDTELSALVATAVAAHPFDTDRAVRAFRRSLLGFLARLPWGIGLTTLGACLRIALGLNPSGIRRAGNGAAMRSAVVGATFPEDPVLRRELARRLAEVTHLDLRAVDGAVVVSEVAALAARSAPDADRCSLVSRASDVVTNPELRSALALAVTLAREDAAPHDAAEQLGTTGYAVHTVAFALYAFARPWTSPLDALADAISVGGDTDTIAAIAGGLVGALVGARGWPKETLSAIDDGPFGPSHLRRLASALDEASRGRAMRVRFSASHALVRNLALYPVILAHGFRRLLPW